MLRVSRRLALLGAALLFALSPVMAQTPKAPPEMSLAEALSGRAFPLSLRLSDLVAQAGEWRQFTPSFYSAPLDASGPRQGAFGLVLFTQGRTFRSNGQTYLVTYRIKKLKASPMPADTVRLPADTTLGLTLLDTATMGSLNGIALFDASTVLAQPQKAMSDSMTNLRQIGLGLLQYTQDYDEKLPPMNSATKAQISSPDFYRNPAQTVQSRLMPYVRSKSVFIVPHTGELYRANGFLSRRNIASIPNPAELVAFYEPSPDANNKRAVLFLDGHVRRINESDWPQLRRASRVTVRLSGAAALYFLYKRQRPDYVVGPKGRVFISESTQRLYVRFPDGHFQWLAPPSQPLEVPYETAAFLRLDAYKGFNGSKIGRDFGGYGATSSRRFPDDVPAKP